LNSLIQKGLASYILKNSIKYYQPAEPSRIVDYIEKKRQELEEKKVKFESLLPRLLLLQSSQPDTSVSVYEGFAGIQTCFERYELSLKSGEEYLCLGIFALQEEKYHEYWKKHHKNRVSQKVYCRMLFNRDTDKKVLKNRNSYRLSDARYMPSDIQTPAWFFIYAEVVCIFLQSDRPVAIEIKNKEIAKTFRMYFEDYWKKSKSFVS
ncbi:MAG: hypothetical protein WCK90_06280, partial [archaeon]